MTKSIMSAVDTGAELEKTLRRTIRDIPDFPKPGVVFKDITPLLLDAELFRRTTDAMAEPFAGDRISHVIGIESRGFILGAPIAQRLGAAFVPIRKRGKLPSLVERIEYALEYGIDALEVHRDALHDGHRVLVVDDVLATGGTADAACRVVERLGATVVGCSFLMVLTFLPGWDRLAGRRVVSLLRY
ncbi:MAG TPA: adenine phosphoribosyltransferase [Gemmatimonadaceae bacterium]|nr:adenine phosphoribosyltransferase [Gemmatimonadaceae bacterium]